MWFLKWFRHSDKLHIQRSSQWPKIRKKHIEKQPCCMACGSCKKPEVHHIVPVHVDPTKELDPDNLITLCDKYCHFMFGHLMYYKSWNENIVKDAERYLNMVKNRPTKQN
tara:strand:+ start:7953 stop:8282 length:330 start_codon:yes stop_codon:yes gene_type:complete